MMNNQHTASALPTELEEVRSHWNRVVGRRSFLKGVGLAGAAMLPASALLASRAMADTATTISDGDIAILRFLAAVELIESDLWQQYNELGGVNGGNPSYMAALSNLDSDMPQYIADNTDDEESPAGESRRVSHAAEQQGDRSEADRPPYQPAGAQRRHELVCPLPQRPEP